MSIIPRRVSRRSLVVVLLMTTATAGCGSGESVRDRSTPVAKERSSARRDGESPTDRSESKVSPADFESIDAAIKALSTAAEAGDVDAMKPIEIWLSMQGERVAEPLGKILIDERIGPRTRVAACRCIARAGPAAKPYLFQAMESENKTVREYSTKWIGIVKPADKELVRKLIDTLGHEEERMRQYAVNSLSEIGVPAKDSVPALIALAQDTTETDLVRDAAQKALRKIAPRRTLQD